MSTVLWANYLIGGSVTSQAEDLYALFKHADKLDEVCQKAGILEFSAIFDETDIAFNMGSGELPDGMQSTDELMARDGNWVDAADALAMLTALRSTIEADETRFGLFSNEHDDVADELAIAIRFAEEAAGKKAQYNFSIVM